MPGHVDLGHDRDEPARRVGDDVRELRLREVSARTATDLRAAADGGEVRSRRDLDAPPLIVREMQVQSIQLVQREQIDVPLHGLDAEEMARDIEHRAAPREARHVRDASARHSETTADRGAMLDRPREKLPDRLHPIEQPVRLGGGERDAVPRDRELIALEAECGVRCVEESRMLRGGAASPSTSVRAAGAWSAEQRRQVARDAFRGGAGA